MSDKQEQQIAELLKSLAERDRTISILNSLITFKAPERKAVKAYANTRLIEILGGKQSPLYRAKLGTVRSALWRDYWSDFNVKSYLDTPMNDYEIVFIWLDEWEPDWVKSMKKGSIAALTASNPEQNNSPEA
jgi:hypothetical protein